MTQAAIYYPGQAVSGAGESSWKRGLGWHRAVHDLSGMVKVPVLPRLRTNVGLATHRAVNGIGSALAASSTLGKATASKARRKLLTRFPVPAEIKWHESLRVQAMTVQSNLEELEWRLGSSQAADVVGSSMYLTGKRWVRHQTAALVLNNAGIDAFAEVLTVGVKSFDITSRMEVTDSAVTVLNTSCPLVDWARRHGMEGVKMCQIFCGENESFFKGVSYSYPLFTNYHAPQMMGLGDSRCKKTFTLR